MTDEIKAALTPRHEAPSSLAGGEVVRAIVQAEHDHWIKAAMKHKRQAGLRSDHAQADLERAKVAKRILDKIAALSPEAPAREAPAEGAGEVHFVGPLECLQEIAEARWSGDNALERIQDFAARELAAALRARSSALEAREGEALEQTARQLAFVYAYHTARKNCSDPNAKHKTWAALARRQSERDWERFLADAKLMQEHTRPAAPSADKLRIAVEAVAWVFELATCRDPETGVYSSWNPPQVSLIKPCVPEGSIRNLTPLGPIANPAALKA